MFSAFTQVIFVLLPKAQLPLLAGTLQTKGWVTFLPPLGDRTHLSLLNGREVARMCPSLPGTAGSPETIPEMSENPLLPGCQKGEVLFLLGCGCTKAEEPPQETAHAKDLGNSPQVFPLTGQPGFPQGNQAPEQGSVLLIKPGQH